MKLRYVLITLVAAIGVAGLAAACGGDNDDGSQTGEIRTQRGPAVAALMGTFDSGESDSAAPVPAPQRGVDVGGAPASDAAVTDSDYGFGYGPFLLQGSNNGVTAVGYGSASADADSAVLELYFGNDGYIPMPMPEPMPGSEPGSGGGVDFVEPDRGFIEGQEVQPITEADLQPVIDAIVGAGVARGDIEFVGQDWFDPYYASASLRVTLSNVDAVSSVREAAMNAAGNLPDNIGYHGDSAFYTISDCSALEMAAMRAAIEDAGERAGIFAQALGVGIGGVVGGSHASYGAFGGSSCESGYWDGPHPGVRFDGEQLAEVSVFASVSVTYAIQ